MPRKQPAAPARNAGTRSRLGHGALVSLALAGLACHHHGAAPPDASLDGPPPEAPKPLTLDIGVTGCGNYDPQSTCDADAGVGPCCTGTPPLTLAFAPIGSPELTQFAWDFGDGTPTTNERAPSHVYAHPGTYQVTLVGGGAPLGGVQPPHPLIVVVEAIATGGFCDVDTQCAGGLSCVCAPGDGCPRAFVRGFCSTTCDSAACAAGAVCAAVSVVPQADAGAGAGAAICVASCQKTPDPANSGCVLGSVCQLLPARPSTAAAPWTHGCLPLGALADIGTPCRDANEALDDQACTTGLCADIGALGLCSATCDDSHPCPDEAACVLMSGGRQLCLPTCTAGGDCGRDPLLTCAAAPRAGGATGNVMVCAPASCSSDMACAPSGYCLNGICTRIAM